MAAIWRRTLHLSSFRPLHRCRSYGSAAASAVWNQETPFADSAVLEIQQAGENLYHLALDVRNNPHLLQGYTRPGQFVQIRVSNSNPAFMAIASPPHSSSHTGSLQFLVRHVEGQTAGLLCTLREGDSVEISQIMGNGFGIEKLSPPEDYPTLLLFCTGTGVSPMRALIESGIDALKREDVRLYYGARNLRWIAYQDRFKYWESTGVKVVPVLSRPSDDWDGERGYVQAAFSKVKEITRPSQTGVVICGQKEMTQDVTDLVIAKGALRDNILTNF